MGMKPSGNVNWNVKIRFGMEPESRTVVRGQGPKMRFWLENIFSWAAQRLLADPITRRDSSTGKKRSSCKCFFSRFRNILFISHTLHCFWERMSRHINWFQLRDWSYSRKNFNLRTIAYPMWAYSWSWCYVANNRRNGESSTGVEWWNVEKGGSRFDESPAFDPFLKRFQGN